MIIYLSLKSKSSDIQGLDTGPTEISVCTNQALPPPLTFLSCKNQKRMKREENNSNTLFIQSVSESVSLGLLKMSVS